MDVFLLVDLFVSLHELLLVEHLHVPLLIECRSINEARVEHVLEGRVDSNTSGRIAVESSV